jgi:thiamine-monophosphate kinase
LDFVPRVREALLLNERYALHAGADVSDGLSLDLSHICEESRVGAILDAADVPCNAGVGLEQALSDGEDFELVLAAPPDEVARMLAEQPLADVKLTRIGYFTAEPGLKLRNVDGGLRELVPRGFEHRLDED